MGCTRPALLRAVCALLALAPSPARAQTAAPAPSEAALPLPTRGSDPLDGGLWDTGTGRPRPLPLRKVTKPAPVRILPALDLPPALRSDALSRSPRLRVPAFHVVGNTLFSEPQLLALAGPAPQELSYEEVLDLEQKLTRFYVDRGYVTSGAKGFRVLDDGSVEFRVTEGVVDDVQVSNARFFRPDYLEARALPRTGEILNLYTLEQRLRALQDDPRIDRVQAELVPGAELGRAELRVKVYEDDPLFLGMPLALGFDVNNHQSPGVGSELGRVQLAHRNLTGRGDVLAASFGASAGFSELEAGYRLPLKGSATSLGVRFTESRGENREEPFDALDIESRSATYALDLEHGVPLTEQWQASLTGSAEYRRSKTFLFGKGFPFSEGVEEDGVIKLAVLRFGQGLAYGDQAQVLSLSSTFSVGVDALGATVGPRRDGRFVSWLGRARFARRLGWWGATLTARADVQLASDALFSLEQFSVGGAESVRGYRENQLLRDDGLASSLEVGIPLWQRASGESLIELLAFYDFGIARNRGEPSPDVESLSSAGLGLSARLTPQTRAEIYFAKGFTDVPDNSNESSLQDRGIHFRIRTEMQ